MNLLNSGKIQKIQQNTQTNKTIMYNTNIQSTTMKSVNEQDHHVLYFLRPQSIDMIIWAQINVAK